MNPDDIVKESGDWRNSSDMIKAGRLSIRLIRRCCESRIDPKIVEDYRIDFVMGRIDPVEYVGVSQVRNGNFRRTFDGRSRAYVSEYSTEI